MRSTVFSNVELSNNNYRGTLTRGWVHEGISLISGLIKWKSLVLSRGALLLFMGNGKLGPLSLGLWLEVLNIFFNTTEHFGYEFCKYFTASAWLIWDQGGQNNLRDVILDKLHCIFSKKWPCLFCVYKFFSLLGRDGRALRTECKSCVQWPCASRREMWLGYKTAVQSHLICEM